MKRQIVLALMMIFLPVNAWALIPDIVSCAYTDGGNQADGSNQWYENFGNTSCGTGFHQGSNIAHEFNLYEKLNISSIETMMVWQDRYFDQIDTVGANMVIYDGTLDHQYWGRGPSGNRIFEQRFSFDETLTEEDYFNHINTAFPMEWQGLFGLNLTLEPGNYWLALEDGTRYLDVAGGPRLNQDELALHKIHSPEPATMFLFGTGLLGAFMRRKSR